MRKKCLAALLAAVLVLSGCGNTASGGGAGSSAGSSAPSGEPAGSSAGAPAGSAAGASAGSEPDTQRTPSLGRTAYQSISFFAF